MKKIFFLILLFLSFFITSVFFNTTYAEDPPCAFVQAYILDLDTNEVVPGATARLVCKGSFNAGPNAVGPSLACSAAEEENHYGRRCWFRSRLYSTVTGTNEPEPINFGSPNFSTGYNCYGGNPKLEVTVPSEWGSARCVKDGSRNDCSPGGDVDINDLDIINGGGFVFKVFYQRERQEVPSPTPTVTPKPGCEKSTCTYTENAPGVCPSGIRVVHGYGTTGHNQPGCNFVPGCSFTECEVPKSPTPTLPPGVIPSKTPTPTSCPVPKQVPNVRVECPYC